MDRKYIRGFVFGLVCMIQFMQCTFLRKGLYMGNCARKDQDDSIKKAGQEQQKYVKLLCVDFYSLFKKGKSGVEDCINIHLPKSLTASTTWNTKYANDGYLIISFGHIEPDKDNAIVLKLEYSSPGIEYIDPGALAPIRNSLHDPQGFKDLIVDCFKKNYKVVIFASIKYPHFIPIVLECVIGFTSAQLSNICIVCNGQDDNVGYQSYEHIKFAERLMGVQQDQGGNGLVISSSLGNPIIDLSSRIDYMLCRRDLEKSDASSSTSSYWSKISAFEEQRYVLIQKAKVDGWMPKKLNNQIWDVAKKKLGDYTRLEYWSGML